MYEPVTGSPSLKAEAKQQTEAERVLGNFDYKLDRLDKLCADITTQVTNAVGFEVRPKDETVKEGPQQGNFIYELDGRLSRLSKLIDEIDNIHYNLSRFV
jgi:hypothetical protein